VSRVSGATPEADVLPLVIAYIAKTFLTAYRISELSTVVKSIIFEFIFT